MEVEKLRPSRGVARSPQLVVLLGSQRSGTTALGRAIAAGGAFSHAGEIFHDVRGPQDSLNYQRYLTLPEANFFSFRGKLLQSYPELGFPSERHQRTIWALYLDYLVQLGCSPGWSIDVKYNSMHHLNSVWQQPLHWPGLLSLLASDGIPVIHVVRRELFNQALSIERSTDSGLFHSHDRPADASSWSPSPSRLAALMNDLTDARAHVTTLLSFYDNRLELVYEEIYDVSGRLTSATRSSVAAFIRMDPKQIGDPDIKKLASHSPRCGIANADEITAYFAGRPFEAEVIHALN